MKTNTHRIAKSTAATALSATSLLTMAALTAGTIYNAVCTTGTVFYDCYERSDCSGACEMFITSAPTSACTAHPGGQCNTTETDHGSAGFIYDGDCTRPSYDCGCEVPPGSTGRPYTQSLTCS